MTSQTNPMTTADAKVELVERLRFERETCGRHSGEGYGLTGIRRLQELLGDAITALEASHSRTEAMRVEHVVDHNGVVSDVDVSIDQDDE